MKGPIGVTHLRAQYGGRKDGGVKPEHVRMGGGAIIRKAIQQLETAGLVESSGNKGRVLTKEGRRLLDSLSTEIKEKLEKKRVKKQKK
jgi:small subunit ribosomal protein S19e